VQHKGGVRHKWRSISKAHRKRACKTMSGDDEAEFMPACIELRGIAIYAVRPGLG